MRFCGFDKCRQPVFGTDKKTGIGYCKSHQLKRTDLDRRSIIHKAIDKQKRLVSKVRDLNKLQDYGQSGLASLVNDLDTALSLYIRLRHADKDGMVKCFCCPKIIHYTKANNSHYIKRGHMATRFLIDNCNVSCPKCNQAHNDSVEPYRTLLINEIGLSRVEWLEEQATVVHKFTQSELKQLLIDIREKLKIAKLKLQPHITKHKK